MKDGSFKNAIDWVARTIARKMDQYPFLTQYLGKDLILVPNPRSSPLHEKTSLWPSKRICEAFCHQGLGSEVIPLLDRYKAVVKSSTAKKGERPSPQAHYDSTRIDSHLSILSRKKIVLVDDVITRGSHMVGLYQRVAEAFPKNEVVIFAVVRTMSDGGIDKYIDPVEGVINYDERFESLHRYP